MQANEGKLKALSDSCYTNSVYAQADIQLNLHPNGRQDPTDQFLEKEVLLRYRKSLRRPLAPAMQ